MAGQHPGTGAWSQSHTLGEHWTDHAPLERHEMVMSDSSSGCLLSQSPYQRGNKCLWWGPFLWLSLSCWPSTGSSEPAKQGRDSLWLVWAGPALSAPEENSRPEEGPPPGGGTGSSLDCSLPHHVGGTGTLLVSSVVQGQVGPRVARAHGLVSSACNYICPQSTNRVTFSLCRQGTAQREPFFSARPPFPCPLTAGLVARHRLLWKPSSPQGSKQTACSPGPNSQRPRAVPLEPWSAFNCHKGTCPAGPGTVLCGGSRPLGVSGPTWFEGEIKN